ncbi:MAG: endoribonuclease MazF [bacterium]
MESKYVPSRGDAVWLDFDPQAGHEQAGHRPALVLSPEQYNEKSQLALFCPITNQKKGYPFEVELPEDLEVNGVVLSDQVRSLDWTKRDAELIESLPDNVLEEVLGKVSTLLF